MTWGCTTCTPGGLQGPAGVTPRGQARELHLRPPPPPAPAPSPPKASPLADHEAFDEEGDDEEAPEEQDEDDALADAREAMASPDGDATPTTGNPSPTVSPFRVTYPIGGGTPPKPPPEEEDEARALADAAQGRPRGGRPAGERRPGSVGRGLQRDGLRSR